MVVAEAVACRIMLSFWMKKRRNRVSRLTMEKDEKEFHVSARNVSASVEKSVEGFKVRFDMEEGSFTALMTLAELQSLGLQCVVHIPSLMPEMSLRSKEDAVRHPARLLKELDDRSIQILLRECQSDVLVDFLWYMKDADLLKLVLRNMSQRAAEMLMEDIEGKWSGKNPDSTLDAHAKLGRTAVEEIMGIVLRLADEGQVVDIWGAKE